MKSWRKRKSAGGNRHLQAKMHTRQISLNEVAGGGLANSRCQGATCFRTLLHPFTAFWLEMVTNGVCWWYRDSARLLGESCWPKNRRAFAKKWHQNRKIAGHCAWGSWVHRNFASNWLSPENKYKFSIFPKKNPNFGVLAKNLSKVCLQKVSLLCTRVSLTWAQRNLFPLLRSWYKTYRGFTGKIDTADFGKRFIELDPDMCERRGACGFLDLYMWSWFESA